ncbi:FecR family protein [Rhodohalobacter sp. 8-1]|uniref:FecR family protein n=1 Tax=Rhodohalobacter sp. 8-1 TaxID=3131972 RepID=UPI0030EC612F
MATPNQELAELLGNKSFTRWIQGNAGKSEKRRWDAWEKRNPSHRELCANAEIFFQMRLELDPAEDAEVQLDRLNKRIVRVKRHKNQKIGEKIKLKRDLGIYRVAFAATILLLLSIAGALYLFNPGVLTVSAEQNIESEFVLAETGYGETSSLKFSDGSLIQLNAKSSLRYNLDQFGSKRVEVWLQGEGYFDIASNPGGEKREFIIHTDNGKIKVLGTKFNVDTRFRKTSVVLEDGLLEVSGNESLGLASSRKILKPGNLAIINGSSSDIEIQNVDVKMFTAWINGEKVFRNTPLKDIFTSIEATYGVKIDVESPDLLDRQITGVFQNPDLQILLAGLQEILDLHIEQVNDKEFLISRKSIQYE